MSNNSSKSIKRIYLDYASGAPVLPSVLKVVQKNNAEFFGNPSSIHKDGAHAKRALQTARQEIAKHLDAHAEEIIFTGSGTEANALALFGISNYAKKLPDFVGKKPHIITTNIEHPSILENCKKLEEQGFDVTYLSVEKNGQISLKQIKESIRTETILISVAYVNNEIGTIFPVKEIAKIIRLYKKQNYSIEKNIYPLLHIDACQAISYLDTGVERLGVDLMSWNGSKIGSTRGIGCLYVRRGSPIESVYSGGGQEFGLRSGTENLAGIIGLSLAMSESRKKSEKENKRLLAIRDFFILKIKKQFPLVRINGDLGLRVSNNINISFQNFSSELLVLELDAKGISVSAGSACGSVSKNSSHVLEALYGKDDEKKWGTIRISLGVDTKTPDINLLLKTLCIIFEKYRKEGII